MKQNEPVYFATVLLSSSTYGTRPGLTKYLVVQTLDRYRMNYPI